MSAQMPDAHWAEAITLDDLRQHVKRVYRNDPPEPRGPRPVNSTIIPKSKRRRRK